MTGLRLRALPGPATEIPVRAQPGASRDEIVGVVDGVLRVRVSAPPVDGAANERLLRFLAKEVLHIPISTLSLSRGERGRDKGVRVEMELEAVRQALEAWERAR